jgi:pimeloyl-ACP methyl ester carboxylesterase
VTSLGDDTAADATGPPRSLRDVLAGLGRRDLGQPGEIDLRLLDGVDDRRRVIVDVPGTKDWSLAGHNRDVTSLVTNLRAIAGGVTTYERGIVEALHSAGVRPGDDVLLVGHSEGGMVAVDAARHLTASGEFHVSHVVTAGAPIGLVAGGVPSDVEVLAVENEGDVVPHLDGAPNPDRVNVTTVTVHHDHGAVLANHDVNVSYVPGAADIDASTDPSLRAYLAGLAGFLTAGTVRTCRYLITRSYP